MSKWHKVVLALLALGAVLGLAACGGDDDGLEGGDEGNGEVETAAAEPIGGEWTISNWPLYIDKNTIDEFDQEVGAETKYIEDINDNFEFFGKLRQQLENGESGGRSMFVVTDYMANIMRELGYLQDLDKSAIPNAENLLPSLESPTHDPNRDYSLPWQTGFTGIIINTDLAPEIKSIEDLFDPKYKGKITFLGDMYDDVTLVLKYQGVDPADATEEDWNKAIDFIEEQSNSGQIRDFTGNAYADDLVKGDIVAAVGWSGDAIQLQADNPNVKWIRPTEGCNTWSDNMVVPVGAPNPGTAQAFMNYVYDPENQAQIAEYVNYVSPVQGVKEVLAEKDPDLANNQLIFPDEEFTADCTPQAIPDPEFEDAVTEKYQSVVTG